jgi:hypothetical protein
VPIVVDDGSDDGTKEVAQRPVRTSRGCSSGAGGGFVCAWGTDRPDLNAVVL